MKQKTEKQQSLTEREEELMRLFWQHGPMFVRELLEHMPEPRPHFNTVSTFVRLLEQKGFLGHEAMGHNHRFYPIVSESEYSQSTLRRVVGRYFNNSLHNAISALIGAEQLSEAEVEELINLVKRKG